jgi:hypothetical protein
MNALPSTSDVAAHEAYHTASLLVDNVVPAVVRIDQPSDNELGHVEMDWHHDQFNQHTAHALLISTLMGMYYEGELTHAESRYPINPSEWADSVHHDAQVARSLSDYLELTGGDWTRMLFLARKRARNSRFRRLVTQVHNALVDRELVLRHELEQILEECDAQP